MFGIAQADGNVSSSEVKLIEQIASYFRISSIEFQQLKSMFYKDASNAYKVLGLDSKATDAEIKKAYRKMAIKHHPDKFAQMGEAHQKAAKEKFQKLQAAYEKIKKERGMIYMTDFSTLWQRIKTFAFQLNLTKTALRKHD